MKNRITASFVVLQTVLLLLLGILPPISAEETVIAIGSKEEYLQLVRDCSLDTWSCGKTIHLTDDIDFSDGDFVAIPTFDGTFFGNGHTLSGLSDAKKGSYQGVFRYLGENGRVEQLKVEGKWIPGGSKSFLGGIVGENAGTLVECSFQGTVKGENVIGGIVGNNTDSGKIISCTSSGNISGENSTGGIAGKNSGLIQNCRNSAAVNTVYEEKKSNLADMDADTGAVLENYRAKEEENEEESVLGHSDTGGLVGYTSGIVQGCENIADVGYAHIGYNVGGIAGRQTGYLLGCQNNGFVQGRKDVGGIVGQAEPYLLLNASESKLKDLREELNQLNIIVNRLITDTDGLGNDTERYLDHISDYAKHARENTETLLRQGTDFVDDNLSEINAQAAILSNALDKMVPVFENLENGSENLADSLDEMVDALEDLDFYLPDFSAEMDDITSALNYISRAERNIQQAVSRANRAKDALEQAISYRDGEAVKNATSDLSAALQDIIDAKKSIQESLDAIENILKENSESFESIGIHAKEIVGYLQSIAENVATELKSLVNVQKSLKTITSNAEINFSAFSSAAQNMEDSLRYFAYALRYISKGLGELGTALSGLTNGLTDYAEDMEAELSAAKEKLTNALSSLSYANDDLGTAVEQMKDIIAELSEEKTLEFFKLGDDFRNAGENLFDSLSGISDELGGLRNTISDKTDSITSDLSAVNNQFRTVMNLLIDEVEELKNGTRSLEDIFVDVSDEELEKIGRGKIADCKNSGKVEADRNTGGIVGSMAIESLKDPEDEIEKPDTLNFTYRSKAVLQSCINDGKIVGKKDCTGGIVGLAEIGTVYECENYGATESTNGNYTGGIAGKSESAIRRSYAKGTMTGKRYVGGIAGKANTITASCAIVRVQGEENTGAVCGDAAKKELLYRNFFTDNGLGAVDGISYREKAEAISFEEMKEISGIPLRFISFTVSFMAEDKVVDTQEIKYGDPTAKIRYPDIPEKEGHFGKWEKPEAEIVTENIEILCEYQPYITMLASKEKNKNGKLALALCEGEFTDEAELHIADSMEKPPIGAEENVKVYELSLIRTEVQEGDSVRFRLLNENKDRVSAWTLRNGKWEKLKITEKGKYVIVEGNGTHQTVCLKYTAKSFLVIQIVSSIAVLVLLLAGFCLLKKKRHRGEKGSIQTK